LRLPESLHKRLKEMAEREGISINQFISTAVTEKLSALMTVEYLEERASRGDRTRFDAVLAKITDAPADSADRIEEQRRPRRRRS
jgi:hypothetical protein